MSFKIAAVVDKSVMKAVNLKVKASVVHVSVSTLTLSMTSTLTPLFVFLDIYPHTFVCIHFQG